MNEQSYGYDDGRQSLRFPIGLSMLRGTCVAPNEGNSIVPKNGVQRLSTKGAAAQLAQSEPHDIEKH